MRKLIILFLILLLPSLSWATTYYVDSSITDVHVASATPDYTTYNPTTFATDTGSDSVYKTIADINAKTFSGGDSILFRKGQTWRENQITPTASSIIYGSFGTGNKPQILCSDQISTWGVYSGNVWSSSHTGAVTQLWFKNASDGKILWGNLKANAAGSHQPQQQ